MFQQLDQTDIPGPTGSQPTAGRPARILALTSAAGAMALGAWAFFFPEHFFINFPVAGSHWVSTLGEFNEHLMRDYGSAQLGLALAGLMAATRSGSNGLVSVMAGYVLFGVLHLGYHLTTFHHFTHGSAAAQATALTTFVVIPLVVIRATRARVDRSVRLG